MNIGFQTENLRFYEHLGMANVNDLPHKKVAIVLTDEYCNNKNAQLIFETASNLTARLFLNIDLYIPPCDTDTEICKLGEHAVQLCRDILPQGNYNLLKENLVCNQYDWLLYIGFSKNLLANATYVFSNGWSVYINVYPNEQSNINALGACAAACFGVAEIHKHIVKPTGYRYIEKLSFSLLNYSDAIPQINPVLQEGMDIGNVTLVGAGAIGSAFIYTLKSLKNLSGTLHIVDQDKYTETNLNRYIVTNQNSIGRSKAQFVKEFLSEIALLTVIPHPVIYNTFIEKNIPIDTLISAVDKRITRRLMQADLPRLILDAATTKTFIDVARIDFGESACLGCLYPVRPEDNSFYLAVSNKTGLTEERVRYLFDTSDSLTWDDINRISDYRRQDYSSYIGNPIDTLYQHEICGTDAIVDKESDANIVVAPISFISVFAGVFLASELIKDRFFPEFRIRNHFKMNTVGIPNPSMLQFYTPTIECSYCNDEIFLKAYRKTHLKSS